MLTNAKKMWAVRATVMVVLICFFAGKVSGSCLSYGHSCWGAHGKRSEVPQNGRPESPQWFLSKLLAANGDLDDAKIERILSHKQFAPILQEPVDPWRNADINNLRSADFSDDVDLIPNLEGRNFLKDSRLNENEIFADRKFALKKPVRSEDNYKFNENNG